MQKLKKYTVEQKLKAVKAYLKGEGSYQKRLNCMTPCEFYFSTVA